MNKILKSMSVLLIAVLCIGVVAACGGKGGDTAKSETAYGKVANDYLVYSKVTKTGSAITDVVFEETESPLTWAVKEVVSSSVTDDDFAATAIGSGARAKTYAKKFRIGDRTFDVTVAGTIVSMKNNDVEFLTMMETEANVKWYFEEMKKGNYDILKADGTAYNVTFKAASTGALAKGDRWLKSKNGYWTVAAPGLGWKGNMAKISAFIKTNGFKDASFDLGDDDIWMQGGVSTGATISNIQSYYNVAKAAYNKIK